MPNEAIGEIDSVGFQSMEREEESAKGLSAEAAAQAHLNGVKDALMEVAKLETQTASVVTTPRGGKNSMITTFKIMKIVMETLRQTNENGKEMSKLLKKEWKAVSDKQSENHNESHGNVQGNNKWLVLGQAAGFSHHIASGLVKLEWPLKMISIPAAAIGTRTSIPVITDFLNGTAAFLNNEGKVKEGIQSLEKISPQLSSAGNTYVQSMSGAEQYRLGIKDSLFQHEVQTHTSNYQNASQQQTSDSQAVDNASDTAKQLIRVQGEILMGKAG